MTKVTTEMLEAMDFNEIHSLIEEATPIRDRKRAEAEKVYRKALEDGIAALGYASIEDFVAAKPKKAGKGTSTLPPKYVGPNGEEWSGKGKAPPEWLKTLIDSGRSKEEFLNPARTKGITQNGAAQ